MTKEETEITGNIVKLPFQKKDQRKAEVKFGAAVMKHGYTLLPNLLLSAQGKLGLGHGEFNVLVQLINHWWEADRDPHPGKEVIARRMGVSPRQVQRLITQLEQRGFITRLARYSGRKAQMANGYDLSPLVAKLVAVEPEYRKLKEQRKIREKKVEGAA